jgi:neuron navigator 2
MERIVEWIPRVWQHLNRILEMHNSSDVTIGPRLFLACPMDFHGFPVWFTDLWNYSLVPYMLEAIREGIQTYGVRVPWEDPTDWVISTCPWTDQASTDFSGLLRIRPEDLGYENLAASSGIINSTTNARHTSSSEAQDPLMDMWMRLQEAASYPVTSSDTNAAD